MKNTWKTLAIGGVAAAAIVAGSLWVADNVSASTTTTTPLQWVQDLATERGGRGGGLRGMGGPGEDGALLAEALGITEEELQAAHEEAMTAAIDQAVEQGLLTQEQADAIKERSDGRLPGMRGFGRFGNEIDYNALLADALGITVEELDAARETAMNNRLEQAVADGDITQEQADLMKAQFALREYMADRMQAAYDEALEQAVEDGVITQEQADLLESQQGGFGRGFGRPGDFGGRGGHHGGRGGMRGLPGAPDQNSPTQEPPVEPNS
jgi:hypothetical protein